jgi:hypothetical protein
LLLGLSGVLKIPLLGRRQIIVLRRHRALHPRLIAAAKSITPSGQLRKNVVAGALTITSYCPDRIFRAIPGWRDGESPLGHPLFPVPEFSATPLPPYDGNLQVTFSLLNWR